MKRAICQCSRQNIRAKDIDEPGSYLLLGNGYTHIERWVIECICFNEAYVYLTASVSLGLNKSYAAYALPLLSTYPFNISPILDRSEDFIPCFFIVYEMKCGSLYSGPNYFQKNPSSPTQSL